MVICIAGKNEIAINIAEHIAQSYPGHRLLGITNRSDNGIDGYFRSYKQFLKTYGIPEVTLADVYAEEELVFLSLEFDRIVDPALFLSKRLYNIHFSFLPAYKGMYTSAWPILNNEKYSGVTLHEIDRGIDTGDIIVQAKIRLDKNETARSLYTKYLKEGTVLVKKNLDPIFANQYHKRRQSINGSTYYSKQSIDYNNLTIKLNVTAQELDAQLRAFNFRRFQLPVISSSRIIRSKITKDKSVTSAGKILEENEFAMKVSTIDYDVVLYKDRFDEFITACRNNDLLTIKKLFQYVDLEEPTIEGWTPLIIACYNNHTELAEYLLKKGADVNASNAKGTSVLMYAKDAALHSGSFYILDIVLAHDPDIFSRDCFNKTVFDYLQHQSAEIAAYIKNRTNDKIS